MGLIGWIKKEIESTSRQRRQSAPPPIAISLTSPTHQNRDEAYLRAITKFNDWRNNQRFERLNETKNASGITQVPPIDQSIITADFSIISDVVIDDNEKRRLIEMRRDDKQKEIRRLNHNVALQNTQRIHRMSLPNMKENPIEKPQRRKNRKSQIHPTNTIDEIEEFEQNHCHQMEIDFPANVLSPPSKFYHDNSDPFAPQKLTPETREVPPRRQSLMGRNMLRRSKSAGKGKAPQPPMVTESEASSNFLNGNFKHYAVDSTSVYDEFLKASRTYKMNMRQMEPEKVDSAGESASTGSLSSDTDKIVKKQRRLSPPYQTVINKHGDEVEYALPYNERDSLSNIPPLPTTAPPDHAMLPQSTFEQIINENFQFLNSNLEFFNAEDTLIQKQMIDAAFEPIESSFSDIRRKNLQITDLDKSNETGLVTPAQSGDICRDLDSLSTWTKNLKNCDNKLEEHSPIDEYKAIERNVKVFNSNEIRFKSGILRNSFSTPLEFSTGYFNTTPVTLRSTLPNVYSINSFADAASKREFEILSQMRHQSISILMGICHDPDLRVMSLVMEPFDYTLNHYLHQMDQYFSIQQTVSIVMQVASATQYLHECGLVHSNISSHAVLISESPLSVKLSSFELTTETLPRESLDKIYRMRKLVDEDKNLMMSEPAELALAEKYYKLSKQHFFNRTSLPTFKSSKVDDDNEARLPYSVAYRRMFSMHYYQAPELLVPSDDSDIKYVLPTPRSDTFALGLLLWEALNHCVPFVVHNHDELINTYKRNDAKLPLLDKISVAFADIFDSCLRVNADERVSDVFELITMLDEIQRAGEGKQPMPRPQIVESTTSYKESKKNLKNTRISEKLPEKIYYSRPETDTLKRADNVITFENLRNLDNKISSKISESVRSSELEAQIASFSQQPGILNDDALDRIRKTVDDQRVSAPQKPTRRVDETPDALEASKRSFADSTMYQSFFDFNRLHTPKVDKNVIYERTSTLKKRLKGAESQKQKKSVKGLFDKQPSQEINVVFDKMNNELSQIVQDYNKKDFMDEIVQEFNNRQQLGRDEVGLSSFLNNGMTNDVHDQSRSFEELPTKATPEIPKIKRSGSDNVSHTSGYRFSVGDYSLLKTPIALKNKIRRNAWLSDGKKSSELVSNPVYKPNKSVSDFSNSAQDVGLLNNRKQYNVSIKIHHNDLETTPKQKSVNVSQNDSNIKIILYPPTDGSSPLVKVNNVELNSSQHDINRKYYPMMPEMLSDVIQNKRDRSGFLQMTPCDEEPEEVVLRRKEPQEDEKNVIVPVRTSVRDAIKFIESTYTSKDCASPNRIRQQSAPREITASTPTVRTAHEETQTEEFITPQANFANFEDNNVSECLVQASESIQKLNEIFQANQMQGSSVINKRVETVVSQTPKKITTKVTMNLKKISRRASDVEHLKQTQEQSRHSICNNNELIKRIQMHFRSNSSLQNTSKNASISASCSSLVPRDKNSEVAQPGKCQKYFCRNCGFTMLPTDVLKKLQSSGRLSIASGLAGSLQSIRPDEGSQSMAALRKCHPIHETRSIEDLYIDDDFCQGISQSLAANMELIQPDILETIDFDLLTAEIFQQHEFVDYTLTDAEKAQLDWNDEEMVDEVFEANNEETNM